MQVGRQCTSSSAISVGVGQIDHQKYVLKPKSCVVVIVVWFSVAQSILGVRLLERVYRKILASMSGSRLRVSGNRKSQQCNGRRGCKFTSKLS